MRGKILRRKGRAAFGVLDEEVKGVLDFIVHRGIVVGATSRSPLRFNSIRPRQRHDLADGCEAELGMKKVRRTLQVRLAENSSREGCVARHRCGLKSLLTSWKPRRG